MIRLLKRVIIISISLFLFTATASYASTGDIYRDGDLLFTANRVRADVSARNQVRAMPPTILSMKVDGNLFRYSDVLAAFSSNPGDYISYLVANYNPDGDQNFIVVDIY